MDVEAESFLSSVSMEGDPDLNSPWDSDSECHHCTASLKLDTMLPSQEQELACESPASNGTPVAQEDVPGVLSAEEKVY